MGRVDSVESRVRSVLTRSFVSAGALLLVLGACFVFHLRPGDPQLGEMSAERWRDVALPFLALVAAFAGLARGISLPGESHREPRVWTRPLLLAAPIPLLALALGIRDVHVSVLFLFAGPATIALAWIAATGAATAQTPVHSWNGLVPGDLFGRSRWRARATGSTGAAPATAIDADRRSAVRPSMRPEGRAPFSLVSGW